MGSRKEITPGKGVIPLPPFLKFHISLHVTYLELLMSQRTELFSLAVWGYLGGGKVTPNPVTSHALSSLKKSGRNESH